MMTLRGIDDTIFKDFMIGIGIAVTYILAKSFMPFVSAIGYPAVSAIALGEVGRFFIVVMLASIVETVIFQELILDFVDEKLKIFKVDPTYFVASIVASITFALFHLFAYGGSLASASGSFISAGLISMVWCYTRKWTDSLLPIMVSHAIINFFIVYGGSFLVG